MIIHSVPVCRLELTPRIVASLLQVRRSGKSSACRKGWDVSSRRLVPNRDPRPWCTFSARQEISQAVHAAAPPSAAAAEINEIRLAPPRGSLRGDGPLVVGYGNDKLWFAQCTLAPAKVDRAGHLIDCSYRRQRRRKSTRGRRQLQGIGRRRRSGRPSKGGNKLSSRSEACNPKRKNAG
jgi:hypothetical protein